MPWKSKPSGVFSKSIFYEGVFKNGYFDLGNSKWLGGKWVSGKVYIDFPSIKVITDVRNDDIDANETVNVKSTIVILSGNIPDITKIISYREDIQSYINSYLSKNWKEAISFYKLNRPSFFNLHRHYIFTIPFSKISDQIKDLNI